MLNGKSFTADCTLVPGVPNVFKLTCENEDDLGAEVTLRTDAAGQVGGAETTSTEGDVTVKTEVPGMGGVGDVPGPASPGQAAAGLLIPSLLAAVLRGLLGGGGGRPVSPVAPRPATPPPPGPPLDGKQAADGKAGTSLKPPPPPPPPVVDATTARALATFDKLSQLAAGNNNPDLAAAVEKAAREALGPDGKVSPERWAAAKAELKQALTRYEQSGDKPTWIAADVARSAARATYDLGAGAATGVAGIATGLGSLGWSAVKGAVGVVAHPIDTTVSAVQAVGQWADNNCPEIKQGFDRGVAEGKLGEVAGHAFAGFGFAVCQAGKALGNFVRNDVLPIDEVKSLFGAY